MTEVARPSAKIPAAPAVTEKSAAPYRLRVRLLHAFSSDWGLRILALVLAGLLWSVVRQDISDEQWFWVSVKPRPASPDLVAYLPDSDRVQVLLHGTQGEIADGRAAMGDDPSIRLKVDDLAPGEDFAEQVHAWSENDPRWSAPGIRRLLRQVPRVRVWVYRLKAQRTRIIDVPTFANLRKGYAPRDVQFEPSQDIEVEAPAGAFDARIAPDLIDVGPYFDGGQVPKGPITLPLYFYGWRKSDDPVKALARARLELPEVKLKVRFVPVVARPIANAIRIYYAGTQGDSQGDYEWEIDGSVPGLNVAQERFETTFRGSDDDLQVLEKNVADWKYELVVPLDEMEAFRKDAEATSRTVNAKLTWSRAGEALGRLPVEFVPPENYSKVGITVTKRPH